jgi:hypothetical protein
MRLAIVLLCLCIYIVVADVIIVNLIQSQRVTPKSFEIWNLLCLVTLLIVQFRNENWKAKLLKSLLITLIALLPWIGCW